MTIFRKYMVFVLCAIVLLTACEKEETLIQDSEEIIFGQNGIGEESLIVLSAPSIHNNYYSAAFDDIIDYLINFAQTVEGKDKAVILADAATMPYLENEVPSHMLLEANVEDIWIRDFGPVLPNQQVKFNYQPDFQSRSISNQIDNSFEDWFFDMGLSYGEQTNLILDGGNVVDNGKDRVIVTDRFLFDNPQLTKEQAKNKLKDLLKVSQVAIIPELAGDATGHADGMLMWATDNTILLHEVADNKRTEIISELKSVFPGVEIVELKNYYQPETWQGFTSACNVFVNSLVTDDYIYMPTFNSAYDTEMFDIVQANTNKTVVPIPAEGVCFMGGSVRCLSWQMKGSNADIIIGEARK